jgi:hypothetical protein
MKIKYPRTYHVEWSLGRGSDDKIQYDLSYFHGKQIVITEKMDGENTTMMNDCYYARSLDSNNHPSRNYVKGIWGRIKHDIPENFRICGENLYAQHSLIYNDLPDYFMVFSIWNDIKCLSWDETIEYCQLLNLSHVNVIYRGIFDLNLIRNIKINTDKQEGFVIRLASEFLLDDFQKSVVKWVRSGHVQTDEHWMNKPIIPNNLKNK